METRRTSRSAERRGEAGLTLVELLVVLAVIATLAALAVPALRGAAPGLAARQAAERLAAEARLARSEAVHGAREGWIEVDLAARRYRRAGGGWIALPEGVGLGLETAAGEVEGAALGRIRFRAEGGATGGRVALAAAGRVYDVTVDWLDGAVAVAERPAAP